MSSVVMRAILLLLLAGLLLRGAATIPALLTTLDSPLVESKDISQEYLLALAVREQGPLYLPLPEMRARYGLPQAGLVAYPSPHPPTAGLIFLPLSWLEFITAARVWSLVQLGLLATSVVALFAIAGFRPLPRRVLLCCLALIGLPPISIDLGLGQLALLQLALLASAVLALRSERAVAAGLLLGVTMLVKPLFAPVLLLLAVKGAWRALGSAITVGAVGLALALVAVGWAEFSAYFTRVLPDMGAIFRDSPSNWSLWRVSPWLALAALAVALVGLRRAPTWAGTSAMVLVSAFISPVAWPYYWTFALLPLAAALHQHGALAGSIQKGWQQHVPARLRPRTATHP